MTTAEHMEGWNLKEMDNQILFRNGSENIARDVLKMFVAIPVCLNTKE